MIRCFKTEMNKMEIKFTINKPDLRDTGTRFTPRVSLQLFKDLDTPWLLLFYDSKSLTLCETVYFAKWRLSLWRNGCCFGLPTRSSRVLNTADTFHTPPLIVYMLYSLDKNTWKWHLVYNKSANALCSLRAPPPIILLFSSSKIAIVSPIAKER